MEIYEKIFERLNEINMSQSELSRQTGIPTSTISDWKKKKMNPQSDKIAIICKVLGISYADLIGDEGDSNPMDYTSDEKLIIEKYRSSSAKDKKRILKYFEQLSDSSVCRVFKILD